MPKLKILLAEDSVSDADLLIRFLKKENIDFSHTRVWQKDAFVSAIEENNYDLVISDYSMPQFSGMEAFRLMKNGSDSYRGKNIPFILITGTISEKLLTEFAKEGIDDYILKENLLRLPSAIENVLNRKKVEKLHRELSEINQKLQSAYTDIKDSINYAQKIQKAMLPERSVLLDAFPKSFVFYRPKDILSGDFYWFQEKKDTFFIAAADCTGHGVPGSLLSMMGNSLINESVNVKRISQPSEILDRLNRRVIKFLKSGTTSVNDGMDIAFCSINKTTKTLVYAGANRPLFIVRKKELLEFKPDKKTIGSMVDLSGTFTNHTIPLKSGDRIFLFSDGFQDQFGEISGKKITTKRLRELLIKFSDLPLAEQEEIIIGFFETWKGDKDQIDDVLVVGVEIQ